ncbi:hypothetical protein C8Q70DRAFT_103818 [Cubamyces menziesii]|nr:hypothetical protein C8Q70DRAFT_103818 [Cubamyces menziesii]
MDAPSRAFLCLCDITTQAWVTLTYAHAPFASRRWERFSPSSHRPFHPAGPNQRSRETTPRSRPIPEVNQTCFASVLRSPSRARETAPRFWTASAAACRTRAPLFGGRREQARRGPMAPLQRLPTQAAALFACCNRPLGTGIRK